MPRKLTTTQFARRLEKARKTSINPGNPYGVRSTEATPAGARGFGLIKRKKRKRILSPEIG